MECIRDNRFLYKITGDFTTGESSHSESYPIGAFGVVDFNGINYSFHLVASHSGKSFVNKESYFSGRIMGNVERTDRQHSSECEFV